MAQEVPKEFHMKDLFIDVKLEACVDGSSFDFLGKKLFSTEFFRENIGFGITSIDIEVNTSLQPLVSVVFKDLYGATIFGGQNRDAGEDNQSIDYSVLFNWPPPKFLFSFKGYLGKPASWVLNLKKTSTTFNASDGSYDIKCEFVPNQWGFFADLPFLFLLAAKRLRKDALGPTPSAKQKENLTSIFDLIKIGKQVEVKTQDTTKEFDELVKQLGSIKSNIARSATVSNIINFGDTIDGVVNNRHIVDFQKMIIPQLSELGGSLDSKEKIEEKLGNARELNRLNTYFILLIKFDYGGILQDGFTKFGITSKNYENFNVDDTIISSAKNQTIEFINKNLKKIEDEIKRLVFSTSESKLEKITIGEIFSQLAKDAAFIIGSILDAGLNGYMGDNSRQQRRDELSGKLIGQAFPLIIKDGEELPATEENNDGAGIGVDDYEMSFVRRFISAISEGIAKDLPNDNATGLGQDDSILKQRINNIEMTSGNPYKSNYVSIATNILVRGGIVGYMTRSNDPNLPGSYDNKFFDNDGITKIKELADRDVQNITDSMINSLSDIDKLLLQRFCNFIIKFLHQDGENIIDEKGEPSTTISNGAIDTIINHQVIMSKSPISSDKDIKLTFSQLWNELKKPSTLENATLTDSGEYGPEILIETSSVNSLSSEPVSNGILNAQHPLSFVNDSTFETTKIMNNNLVYTYPNAIYTKGSPYWAVVFRGQDNKKAQEANSSPTDGEYKNKDKDVTDAGQNEPLGYIAINSKFGDDGATPLDRVLSLEDYRDNYSSIGSSVVFDFDALKHPNPIFYGATSQDPNIPGMEQFLWENQIASNYIEQQRLAVGDLSIDDIDIAGNFGWTVCAHQTSGFDTDLVFGLFNSSDEGRSQRVFIQKMCENIKKSIDKIEEEQNQVIGSVLGKAGEQEGAIYKQMHTLYHQWQSLSYSSDKTRGGCLGGNSDEFKDGNSFNIATALEKKFGGNHTDILINEKLSVRDQDTGEEKILSLTNSQESNGVPDGTFIYDYPLQRIKPDGEIVQVRDSIINLESLYKANGETSVLNIIQQICTKNNFLFVPIPGNPNYLNVTDIYTPYPEPANIDIRNFFHVLFTPTPESRTKTRNKDGTSLALNKNHETYNANSFVIKYGHPDNQIVSNIQVGTDDTKVTAESIINLQRLVDNENQNKKVTTDCSMLPVLAGRSYKASVDMLGNAQVYPMQLFFLKNSPLFGGLYQVMKVKHSISPNDFKTNVEGIRMRFSPDDGYGAIKPITLQTFRDLGALEKPVPFTAEERVALSNSDNASLISGNAASTSGYDANHYVDGNKGGPIALVVPILTASELHVFDLGVGVRDIWRGGAVVGSEQMYVIDGSVMTAKALSAYKSMRDSANSSGVKLRVVSGYRDPLNPIIVNGKKIASSQYSLREQNVKDKSKKTDNNYLMTAGSGNFNAATAAPGKSNHGGGTALDLSCGGAKFKNFNQSIFEWLMLNAYKYGFVRAVHDRAGKGEEWHWEYSPGASMFSLCYRDDGKWYGLVESLNIPKTKDEIKTA